MPALSAIVARNVRAERARQRWTQTQLAQVLNWSAQMVSETETGQRRVGADDLPLLCRAFGITLAKLADGAEQDDIAALGI
jgi:transcriptional regulator with XRE-family HTH domain